MSKAYSNKALPAGTILREWRLEQVLGVGGFGIVYKGRGIYFDELVAIKEYFPSAISERDEDATVVPIDSDAEEVHALGLKKFVEEAKLLWNLSTPSRHPNIVSVRSLFEIHGTAYMVMDFEDGTSLSKILKSGRKFNEASLSAMILPVVEGLHRAHRVGVLHRDIKPPNIVVNDDGRSVLIDFGSARFESGDATSTSVTFHTPPYAAIEQYVRTYEQGPWTDIYALGVVLYECVTGSKPPEVLERLHGNAGTPLLEGNWPGYSRGFLAAVDKAMTIHPDERPRTIPDWLEMFRDQGEDRGTAASEPEEGTFDEDATRISSFVAASPEIVPVAPPPPGFDSHEKVDTAVPVDPAEAEFSRSGEEREKKQEAEVPPPPKQGTAARGKAETKPRPAATREGPAKPPSSLRPKRMLLAGAAAILVALVGGSWLAFGGSEEPPAPRDDIVLADENFDPDAVPDELDLAGAVEPDATEGAATDPARKPATQTTRPATKSPTSASSEAARFISTPVVQAVPSVQQATVQDVGEQAATPAGGGATNEHRRRLDQISDDANGIAREVVRLERRDRPGSNATDVEREGYRVRQANAETARNYQKYLDQLKSSMRTTSSASDAEKLIANAEQTRRYLRDLRSASNATFN